MNRRIRNVLTLLVAGASLVAPAVVYASNAPTFNQTVNTGVLTADIVQSDNTTTVASPSVSFPALNRSFNCQTNTATLGDSNNRIYVTNFGSNNGFSMTMAATGGPTATWTSGSDTYKFNDAAGSGCTNGQLTVDASVGTVTLNCNSVCTSTNITKGASTAFVSGTTNAVPIFSNNNASAWSGYLTGVSLSQKVPASQVAGSYSLGMTLTTAAL